MTYYSNKMNISIKRFNLNHVLENNKVLYNTNNHYNMEKIDQPKDYKSKAEMTETRYWIDAFHDEYYKITLDKSDLKWIREAFKISTYTLEFPKKYEEDLEETCSKHNIPKGNYFIRTDTVSLKHGLYGVGPYNSLEKIIKSIVSARFGHECLNDNNYCNIYFMKWLEIDTDKEFRIFVFENKISAISVQNLYKVNKWLNDLNDEEIKNVIIKIIDYFEKNIKDKLKYLTSYVMDLALINYDSKSKEFNPYFIEPNTFGRYYSSGSALFQWKIDEDILLGKKELEFRYVSE